MGRVPWLAAGALVLLGPEIAGADLVCPLCDETTVPLSVGAVVEYALSTLLQKGLGILLLGALVVVGLPWTIAGLAVAAVYLPGRLKSD